MNLNENIAIAQKFQGRKAPMTLTEANAEVPQRAKALFGVSMVKRLAEAKKTATAEETPASRNPTVIH